MIGVVVKAADLEIVTEFFELFKTPWQLAAPDGVYDVVLVADDESAIDGLRAKGILIYGSNAGTNARRGRGPVTIRWNGSEWPIYGDLAAFDGADEDSAAATSPEGRVERRERKGTQAIWRIGYDLFDEVRQLLTAGQPSTHAATATLELHIALLRARLEDLGASFVEVPARPFGFDFVCCLTHDIDFCGITRHRLDPTMAGFVWRASVGTLVGLVRGRRRFSDARQNWSAVALLPLTYLGLTRDFWDPFGAYADADRGRPSTFFVIPFKGRPGIAPDGTVKRRRAVRYGVRDIREQLNRTAAGGSEVALHGIDGWRSDGDGRSELGELRQVVPAASTGVRMHWLFFDAAASPGRLQAAGFEYDATFGYNDAIGHRAGTAQAFTFPGTGLFELPLSIMDTAMFYRDRMGLAFDDAMKACRQIVSNVRRFGGALVINWHDRSLAPERLWRRAYEALLHELEAHHTVWFATAQQAVAWFRWRRSIRFAYDPATRTVRIEAPTACPGVAAPCVTVSRSPKDGGPRSIVRFDGTRPLTISI